MERSRATYSFKTYIHAGKEVSLITDEEIRECWNEEETNQLLDMEDINKTKNASYEEGARPEVIDKITKRFKYQVLTLKTDVDHPKGG